MQINIFGKLNCARCETTKRKLTHFLDKWSLADRVQMTWVDMDSVDGRAEGAFEDVYDVPTVIVKKDEEELRRWTAEVPDSNELKSLLEA